MATVKAVISDFGGVLTSPLMGSFEAFRERSGVSLEVLGQSIAALAIAQGSNPLFELETGRLSEGEFLGALAQELTQRMGRTIELDGFGETYFAELDVNEPFLAYLRELQTRGYRLAICTNNVREWEPLWRAMVPVDELFEVVIDSSAVGSRKPERQIYEETLAALGVQAPSTVFVDDLEINCAAARQLGMRAVWFQTTEQAMADIESVLADGAGR